MHVIMQQAVPRAVLRDNVDRTAWAQFAAAAMASNNADPAREADFMMNEMHSREQPDSGKPGPAKPHRDIHL